MIKAWNNDIQEVQHEISLFGSLKTVDVGSVFCPLEYMLTLFLVTQKQINISPDNIRRSDFVDGPGSVA